MDRIKTEHRFRYLTCERENHDENFNQWPMCRLSTFIVIMSIRMSVSYPKKYLHLADVVADVVNVQCTYNVLTMWLYNLVYTISNGFNATS